MAAVGSEKVRESKGLVLFARRSKAGLLCPSRIWFEVVKGASAPESQMQVGEGNFVHNPWQRVVALEVV